MEMAEILSGFFSQFLETIIWPYRAYSRARLVHKGRALADKRVAVIMTAYNSAQHIGDAIRSVLSQTHENLELIIVDDASSDTTVKVASAFAEKDKRVKIFSSKKNRGTYWCKNWAMQKVSTDFVTFHDSDDISSPDRISLQLGAFSDARVVAATVRWQRVDVHGEIFKIDGKRSRLAAISLMLHKSAIAKVGYFDSVRIAADTEYLERIETLLGKKAIAKLPHIAYTGLLRENSLTTANSSGMTWHKKGHNISRSVTGARRDYLDAARVWHLSGQVVPLDFPIKKRPFPVSSELVMDADDDGLDCVSLVS